MYGKIFESLYEGSMCGAGCHVFAVWGYVIARKDHVDGTVTLNPKVLAPILGGTVKEIESAIHYLCEPDPHSRNPDEEGRRLIHESGLSYRVVGHSRYREITNNEARREYERGRKRAYRDRINSNESENE